jgi:hypothetical protein
MRRDEERGGEMEERDERRETRDERRENWGTDDDDALVPPSGTLLPRLVCATVPTTAARYGCRASHHAPINKSDKIDEIDEINTINKINKIKDQRDLSLYNLTYLSIYKTKQFIPLSDIPRTSIPHPLVTQPTHPSLHTPPFPHRPIVCPGRSAVCRPAQLLLRNACSRVSFAHRGKRTSVLRRDGEILVRLLIIKVDRWI